MFVETKKSRNNGNTFLIFKVMILMSDRRKMAALYMEEKRRSDELAAILRDEKNKVKVSCKFANLEVIKKCCIIGNPY